MLELLTSKSLNNKFLVFNDTMVPKIYENIKVKVSRNEGDSERVVEFMKQMKAHQVVENIKIRPETKYYSSVKENTL